MEEIKYKIYYQEDHYDSDDVRFIVDGKEKGFGFLPKGDKIVALSICPRCGRNNYALNILTGQCTWCPFNTKEAILDENA